MNEEEKQYIYERIKDLEESIKLLKDKEYKETWVVNEFLSNLNIKFDPNEILKTDEEPPDVIFRNANFEIKAIYDENRRMLKEYQEDLIKAKKACSFNEAFNFREYNPVDISIQEIVDLVNARLRDYIVSTEQYQKIDMLFYFNRFFTRIADDKKYTISEEALWKKWRSVSVVKNGGVSFILWARDNAPDFIKMNTGIMISRKNFLP